MREPSRGRPLLTLPAPMTRSPPRRWLSDAKARLRLALLRLSSSPIWYILPSGEAHGRRTAYDRPADRAAAAGGGGAGRHQRRGDRPPAGGAGDDRASLVGWRSGFRPGTG